MEARTPVSSRWETLDQATRNALQQRLQKARNTTLQFPIANRLEGSSEFLLSPSQERLWLLEKLQPGTATYNVLEVFRLKGDLNVEALENSFRELYKRHESLRTAFRDTDGDPMQFIESNVAFDLHVTRVPGGDLAEREQNAQSIISEIIRRPFNLQKAPLSHVHLLQIDERNHLLVWVLHHIITDGRSNEILMSELMESYRACQSGGAARLPALPVRYVDFAAWQRAWMANGSYQKNLAYWRKKLANLPIPAKRSMSSEVPNIPEGAQREFVIDRGLTSQLVDLAKNEGATLFMVTLAAFKALLHGYSQQHDIIVGSPVANRNRPDFEMVAGCFVNVLVLRTKLDGAKTFRDMLHRVRDTALEAFTFQEIPFEQLVKELRPPRATNGHPFFDTAFMFENFTGRTLSLPGLTIERIPAATDTAMFDLTMALSAAADHIDGVVEFRPRVYPTSTITRLITDYIGILQAVVANPAIPLAHCGANRSRQLLHHG